MCILILILILSVCYHKKSPNAIQQIQMICAQLLVDKVCIVLYAFSGLCMVIIGYQGGDCVRERRGGIDLTQGRISSVLVKFAWPFVAANLVTALHGMISLLVVGQFTNRDVISGVATGAQIMSPILSFIMGMGTGGTVLIGRCIGEKDDEAGTKAVGSFSIVSVIVIVFLTLFMLVCREPLLKLLQTPMQAMPSASSYVLLCTIGVPFNIAFGMISAIARGIGNSRTPSIAAGIGCAVNITLSLLLVGVFKLSAAGAAIAASVAQFSSFIFMALWLYTRKLPVPFTKSDIRVDSKSVKFLLRVGFPLVLQDLLVSVAFMINANRVNILGVEASASVGVVMRVFSIAAVFPNAIGSAISAMTAQNIGAGKRERAAESLRWGLLYAIAINTIFCAYSVLRPESITALFAWEPDVINGAANYLRSFSIDMIFVAGTFCMNAYLGGCGKSTVSMWYMLATAFLVRVPLSIYITGLPGLNLNNRMLYLGFASPAASLVSLIIGLAYIVWYNKRATEGIIK